MRRSLLSFYFLLMIGCVLLGNRNVAAQSGSSLPAFGMFLSNGRYFKASDLPKNKPVLLIYFAPDCDHCHTLMNAFFQRAGDFSRAEVILVTYKPVNELAAFEQAYQTYRYPNIKVGTEGTTYFLRNYYRLQQTPFTALYNRQGKLVASYHNEAPLDEISRHLKQL